MKLLTIFFVALTTLYSIVAVQAEHHKILSTTLQFAVLGDAEPKPLAEFPHLTQAVEDINQLSVHNNLDFVIGVGDLPHKGTMLQYKNITPVLQALNLPFYPIMGNEEHSGENASKRFLDFANQWNQGKVEISATKYVLERDKVALVMASPDEGRDFNDAGIDWIISQLKALYPKPVMLVVHGAQLGIYHERADKGITNPRFVEVVAQPNLRAVISGDLHMDMDRVEHSKQVGNVHYLHIPALERTKIPDETQHNPMYRVFKVLDDGSVEVNTYALGSLEALARHHYRFNLSL